MPATRLNSLTPARPRPRAEAGAVRTRVDLTPEELALRAQDGSAPAFAELVDRFETRLFNFLLRRVNRPADAEDLVQEAFIRAWQRIGTYRPEWRFSTWLFTIATRLTISQARRRTVIGPQPIPTDGAAAGSGSAQRLEQAETRSRVWSLVAETLGPEQHSALWLRYVEGLAVKDIARVMGRSQVSVRVMLFRARAVLAERLSRDGESISEPKPEPRRHTSAGAPC